MNEKRKKLSADKPDSVVPVNWNGHHLSCHNIAVMILLPTLQSCFGFHRNIERAALWLWCTWHYSTQGLPNNTVTRNNRELLPHVFTLIQLMKARRLFSVALSVPVCTGPGN